MVPGGFQRDVGNVALNMYVCSYGNISMNVSCDYIVDDIIRGLRWLGG